MSAEIAAMWKRRERTLYVERAGCAREPVRRAHSAVLSSMSREAGSPLSE